MILPLHNASARTPRFNISALRFRLLSACAVLLLGVSFAFAVGTQFWTSATFEDFQRGNFTGVSLAQEGTMSLAPKLDEIFHTDQAMIWAAVKDQRGTIYLGTGNSGKVFHLGPDFKSELYFDAEEPDVFALAVDNKNRLYVGTSPDGKIYRVDAPGKATEFYSPKTKYIWSMIFAPDGTLYVGTGDRGRIYRVKADGTGDVFYETNQNNIMSLALAPNGDLIAGTEPNGLLYRISSAGKAFIVYDASLAEIHQVSLGTDGSIYAAAMGAATNRRIQQSAPQTSPGPIPVTTTTTITVRASDDPTQIPSPGSDQQPGQGGPDSASSPQADLGARFPASARPQQGGQARSSIVRIFPDNTVDTLWSSNSENAFDLLPSDNQLLFSTDEKGRIYQLLPNHQLSLLTQTDQEQTTRLIPLGNIILVTTANLGKVYRLGSQPLPMGTYESEIRDAGNTAGWGRIRWKAALPQGSSLELYTRSGNSNRPDQTWSDWSSAYRSSAGEQIASPPARYLQWKAVFHSAADHSPVLREVTVAYLAKNRAPELTEVKAVTRPERSTGVATAGVAGNQAAPRVFSGVTATARSGGSRTIDMSWLATDPDNDELTYTVYFRGEGESDWKLLQDGLRQNYLQLNPETLPDGDYRIKVVASDSSANTIATTRTTDRISAPFTVDHTPPVVELQGVTRNGAIATVRFRAVDAASVLTRAEYALDAQPLQPLLSTDGILDSSEETFAVELNGLDAQEHLVTVRVYDFTGNVGLGKAVLQGSGQGAGLATGQAGRTP